MQEPTYVYDSKVITKEEAEQIMANQAKQERRGAELKPKYPHVEVTLTGENGNAFAIMGKVCGAMRRAGVNGSAILDYQAKATAGDYNHLLQTTMQFVTVR